ncbi:hypothetical protein [Streptomyces nodosus]|uniref:hypothetical protein n=1 Tax=Streptomyces nodosus TaxID=40318 RepID=UPI00383027F3
MNNLPRLFHLQRDHDVSGVSGTGRVADGVLWPDGTVALRWIGQRPSTVHWDRLDDAAAIHGHGGATHIVWADEQPTAARAAMLRAAADAVFALDYDDQVADEESIGSIREAWEIGTVHATELLRHMADEVPTAPQPPVDRASLRQEIRRVLAAVDGFNVRWLAPEDYGPQADAVLAVLPATTDQAAVTAAGYDEMGPQRCQAGRHPDWAVDSEQTHACPWCEVERLRADRAAVLDRFRVVVRRLAAHAVGFQDVLDESDRGPWGKTVGADITELRRMADGAQS